MTNTARLALVQTIVDQRERIWSLSAHGSLLATACQDRRVRIYRWEIDAENENDHGKHATCAYRYRLVHVLEGQHARSVRSVAFSPKGLLATAGFDGFVNVYADEMRGFEHLATLEGHENEVKCVTWSADGQLLASCSRDKSVWVWSLQQENNSTVCEFECVSVLSGHTQDVKCCVFFTTSELERDKQTLISGSYDDSVKIWRYEDDDGDWYLKQTLQQHTSTVWSIAVHGQQFVTCSDDLTIRLFEQDTKNSNGDNGIQYKQAYQLPQIHTRTIYSVAWSEDDILASGAGDDSISIYTRADGNSKFEIALHLRGAHDSDVNCVTWLPNLQTVKTDADRKIAEDNHIMLASAGDDNCVKIWRWYPT